MNMRILRYISWKSICAVLFINVTLHILLIEAEINAIVKQIEQRTHQLSPELAKNILDIDIYNLNNYLNSIRGRETNLMTLITPHLLKNGFDKVQVGSLDSTIWFGFDFKNDITFDGNAIGHIEYTLNLFQLSMHLFLRNWKIYCFILCIQFIFLVIHLQFSINIILALEKIVAQISHFPIGTPQLSPEIKKNVISNIDLNPIKKEKLICKSIINMGSAIDTLLEKERLYSKNIMFQKIAKQVAHDIRSPLSALEVIATRFQATDQAASHLASQVSKRIRKIADDLLLAHRHPNFQLYTEKITKQTLSKLSQSLADTVKMKQIENKNTDIHISYSPPKVSEDHHVLFTPIVLDRIISNLINNSIEAKTCQTLNILVTLEIIENSLLKIKIQDNGKGIKSIELEKIISLGKSFGKSDGNGIGIKYAKEHTEKWNGIFKISSIENIKTIVTLELPLC